MEVNAATTFKKEVITANTASKHAFFSSVVWLILGVLVGLWMAAMYAFPDLIHHIPMEWRPYLEFGKVRQVHVNILAFAWLSLCLIAGLLYAIPNLARTPLRHERAAMVAVYCWNAGLILGNVGLITGHSRGREYASMTWPSDLLVIIAFALLIFVVLSTLVKREVRKMNVAIWYLLGSIIWMPLIIILGKGLYINFFTNPFNGYFDNVANWFLGHNILGLWFTTLGLGMSYFLIPRITNRPIYNLYLSIIGIWTLAVFYPAVGAHHTLDGPVPNWLGREAIVFSILMIIPVFTALYNLYKSVDGRWDLLSKSTSLSFVTVGLVMYLAVSIQGSFQALMFVSNYLHFSQWVPGHAMLALGGGFSFIAFGTIYYALPKIIKRHWFNSQLLIAWHFWLSLLGISGIFFSLTTAGLVQGANWQNNIAGMHWLDAVVRASAPEMKALLISGAAFFTGQLIFFINFMLTVFKGNMITLHDKEDIIPLPEEAVGREFRFESSLPRLITFYILAFSFAVITTYAVPFYGARQIKPNSLTVQYQPLEAQGRNIYIREGCLWCHSQMVRHSDANVGTVFRRGDIGNYTPPEWYINQNPLLIGQHRRGPDLSHDWERWPSDFWETEHLKDPSRFWPGTWMPPFSYLSDNDLQALVAYLKTLE